jgi:peptidoglycan L-alanyl-D-glutamate endopeptidase CwlK
MASRSIEDLHPAVEPMCRRFLEICGERGIRVVVTSTLRTEAEQIALFAQGRKNINTVNELRHEAGLPPVSERENRIVTHALTSIHQFGCAFDVVLVKPIVPAKAETQKAMDSPLRTTAMEEKGVVAVWDVKADINSNDVPDYEEIGIIGESVGLTWGGRFKFRDYCHFQYTGDLTLEELKAGRRLEYSASHDPSPQVSGNEKVPSSITRSKEREQSQGMVKEV